MNLKDIPSGSVSGILVLPNGSVWMPSPVDLGFAAGMIQRIGQDGLWKLPSNGQVYQFDHANKTLWLVHGEVDDVFIKTVITWREAVGWRVEVKALPGDARN